MKYTWLFIVFFVFRIISIPSCDYPDADVYYTGTVGWSYLKEILSNCNGLRINSLFKTQNILYGSYLIGRERILPSINLVLVHLIPLAIVIGGLIPIYRGGLNERQKYLVFSILSWPSITYLIYTVHQGDTQVL